MASEWRSTLLFPSSRASVKARSAKKQRMSIALGLFWVVGKIFGH